MGQITWTRNEYTAIANSTDRQAWYEAAELDKWASITMDTSAGSDAFSFNTGVTGGAYINVNFQYMHLSSGTSNTPRVNTVTYYPQGASATATIYYAKPTEGVTDGHLSFDTASIGTGDTSTLELLRICTSTVSWQKMLLFAVIKGGVNVDSDTSAYLLSLTTTHNGSASDPTIGSRIILDPKGRSVYAANNSTSIQFHKDNTGFCDKYILQPVPIMGVKSALYSIDGGTSIPVGDVEFIVQGHTYYSLGHGLCVRIK